MPQPLFLSKVKTTRVKMISSLTTFLLTLLVWINPIAEPFVGNPEIVLNGTMDEPAWSMGKTIAIDPVNTLRILQDENFLYLANHSVDSEKRYMEILFINREGDQMILHASMQLGERIAGQDGGFRWGTFDSWDANTTLTRELESDIVVHREFRIQKNLLGPDPFELIIRLTSFFDETDTLSIKIRLKTTL
jgi:hypothetical protein